jgi:outer membrane lipoprotein-sorting protein
MKIHLCYLILFFSVVTGMAQDNPGEILDKVSAVMESYTSIQTDFSFTMENKEADISDTYEGSLVMQGEKFRLSLMGMLAFSDGKTMWVYMEEFNEANIMDPSESEFFNPKNIFNINKEDYMLRFLGKENELNQVELKPLEEDENFKLIILKIDPLKNHIKEVFYEGLDGNNYLIKIKNLLSDIIIDDRFFSFDKEKYPGVEVYDMR